MIKIVLCTAAATVLLSGCSEVDEALNKGADTPCSDFVTQSADEQRQTITKGIKEQTNSDSEPLGTAVDAAIVSVNLLCQIQTNRDVPIKNADLLGAVVPR